MGTFWRWWTEKPNSSYYNNLFSKYEVIELLVYIIFFVNSKQLKGPTYNKLLVHFHKFLLECKKYNLKIQEIMLYLAHQHVLDEFEVAYKVNSPCKPNLNCEKAFKVCWPNHTMEDIAKLGGVTTLQTDTDLRMDVWPALVTGYPFETTSAPSNNIDTNIASDTNENIGEIDVTGSGGSNASGSEYSQPSGVASDAGSLDKDDTRYKSNAKAPPKTHNTRRNVKKRGVSTDNTPTQEGEMSDGDYKEIPTENNRAPPSKKLKRSKSDEPVEGTSLIDTSNTNNKSNKNQKNSKSSTKSKSKTKKSQPLPFKSLHDRAQSINEAKRKGLFSKSMCVWMFLGVLQCSICGCYLMFLGVF